MKNWRWRLVLPIGATNFHTSNHLPMNVRSHLYPFAFVIFFGMAKAHRALEAKLRLRAPDPAPAG